MSIIPVFSAFFDAFALSHSCLSMQACKGRRNYKQKDHLRKYRKWSHSGGGGNRTRVPWHFRDRFYVCSLPTSDVFLVPFASGGSDKQDPPSAIEQVF